MLSWLAGVNTAKLPDNIIVRARRRISMLMEPDSSQFHFRH